MRGFLPDIGLRFIGCLATESLAGVDGDRNRFIVLADYYFKDRFLSVNVHIAF
jgi:hypothetical protein